MKEVKGELISLGGDYFIRCDAKRPNVIHQQYSCQKSTVIKRTVRIFDYVSVAFTLWVFYLYLFVGVPFETDFLLENPIWVQIAVILTFIREFSDRRINLKRTVFNPAQIFILSFLVIILTGSFLLVLPNATHDGIFYLDALFTSTSAVCVTGLVVVSTGTHFTLLGQTIIMILIQVGGLGILTFVIYFSYFFKDGTTYENQLALSDMTSSKKLGEVLTQTERHIQGVASADNQLEANDILVLFGSNKDLQNFLKQKMK